MLRGFFCTIIFFKYRFIVLFISPAGVIIFASDQEVGELMSAVARRNATGTFSWIGSDGWGGRAVAFEGKERQVKPLYYFYYYY